MATASASIASKHARVALVTGANQGIGLEIVRQLCHRFKGTVLLAARNVDKGQSAVMELMSEGLHPVFLPLDVCSEESIQAAKEAVQSSFGRLDILINNAGVLFRTSSRLSLAEKARQTILTNYHGVLNVTNAFWSLLQPDSRIVNLSSGLGRIIHVPKEKQDEILAPDMTIEKLTAIMDRFVQDCQLPEEEYATKGWPPADGDYTTYSVSKVGVHRLTELLAEKVTADPTQPRVLINAVSPGWVRTQMGTSMATLSTEEGADTPVYVALMPPGETEPHGKYLYKREAHSWRESFKGTD